MTEEDELSLLMTDIESRVLHFEASWSRVEHHATGNYAVDLAIPQEYGNWKTIKRITEFCETVGDVEPMLLGGMGQTYENGKAEPPPAGHGFVTLIVKDSTALRRLATHLPS